MSLEGEFSMGMRKLALAAALGVSLASAPVMAQSNAQPVAVDRAGATVDDANAQSHGFPFLIVFVVIAVGLGLYFAIEGGNDDGPTSP
jgi:hypothetical protein